MYDLRAEVNWSEFSRAWHTFLMCCGISSRMPGWQRGACVPGCELCTHTDSKTTAKQEKTTTCTLTMLQAKGEKKEREKNDIINSKFGPGPGAWITHPH